MLKVVCGVDIQGSTAVVVTLSGDRKNPELMLSAVKKIELKDDNNQADIHSFRQTIASYINSEGITDVSIKKRASKGQFSAGAASFKIESIFQTLDVPVTLVHTATIAATLRKQPIDLDKFNLLKYQVDAFTVAYYLLEE
ncbi:DUF3010 family protein [Brevibacillus sp. SYSU BS000544]|uniref:DUF3010 family protein n=1 Tax=Brevibacillus sp. SYSU BS000544 TaxID=3416443 RepID=UPI003CE590A8